MLKNYDMAPNTGDKAKAPTLAELVEAADEETLQRIYSLAQAKLQLDITKVNLAEALMVQYQQATRFLDEILHDKEVPANQRAQAMNSANASLKEIIKQRGIVMSQERQKRYEVAFLKTLELLGTEEMKIAFMDMYGEYLDDRGQ